MLAILFFLLSLAFGYSLLRLLPLRLSRLEQAALSVVTGILLSSWLLFLFGWLITIPWGIALTVVLEVVCMILSHKFLKPGLATVEPKEGNPVWRALLAGVSTLLVGFFLYLCYTHTLQIQPDGWYNSGYTWSDMPLHMSLISGVAYRPRFEFLLPVYYMSKLSYPFLIDMYAGVLLRLGGIWQLALFLPTAALMVSLIQLFLSLTSRLLGSVRAAWIHLSLFLFSGSAWGTVIYFQDVSQYAGAVYQLKDYSNLEDDQRLYFANIVTSHLFPQRGFLFGFATALAILLLVYVAYQKPLHKSLLAAIGVLTGLLPFVHVHTYFVIAALLLILAISDVVTTKSWRSRWLLPLGLAILIALPQVWWQFAATYHSNFGYWYIGWARAQNDSALLFWIRNWGLTFFFVFINFWLLRRYLKDNRLVWLLYLLAMAIFLAINIRIFQPNVFDNMKFLIYGFWGVTLVMSYGLAAWSRHWKGAIVSALILILSTFTGALVLARETSQSYLEFSNDDVAFAQDFRVLVPATSRVLTTERHTNPVPALTGRLILEGYPGWLWSYGIDVTATGNDIATIFAGQPTAPALLHKYGVQYIAFNLNDMATKAIDLNYFAQNEKLIYNKYGWYIFAVR